MSKKSGFLRHITVTQDDDGQRLDRWLKRVAPDVPYVLVQKLLRKGQIRIDGKRVKPDTKLVAGQSVKIPPVAKLDDQHSKRGLKELQIISSEDEDFIRSLVIHDDGDVIALNKPAGIPVQGGTNIKRHIDGLLDVLVNKEGVRPRLVHRLDKDTSGILLLARSSQVAKKLGAVFKDRDVKKIYWALVSPVPNMREGTIRAPLIKAGGPDKEKMIVDEEFGKTAFTDYVVLENVGEQMAFVAFWPRTGRMHQIRVHAQMMGTPVLGDWKYRLEGEEAAELRGQFAGIEHARRLHLHAHRITLKHPTQKDWLDISAPLPEDLATSWKRFGFDPNYKGDPFIDGKF